MAERKSYLLRLDPAVFDALQRWAADDLRSLNAQIEFLLRQNLTGAGRLASDPGAAARRYARREPPPPAMEPPSEPPSQPPSQPAPEPPSESPE